MSKQFAELSFFSRNVQPHEYQRGNVTLTLEIDIDAFTSDYFRAVRSRMRERFAKLATQDRESRDKMIAELIEKENAKPAISETQSVPEGIALIPELTPEVMEKRLNLPDIVDPDQVTAYLEVEAKSLETKKDILIELLRGDLDDTHEDGSEGSGVLVEWNIPNVDIKCTRETLQALSPRALEDLWEFCASKARTVKKTKDETSQMMSEITAGGLLANRGLNGHNS